MALMNHKRRGITILGAGIRQRRTTITPLNYSMLGDINSSENLFLPHRHIFSLTVHPQKWRGT